MLSTKNSHLVLSEEDVIQKTHKSCYVHSKTHATRVITQRVQEGNIILLVWTVLITTMFDNAFQVSYQLERIKL